MAVSRIIKLAQTIAAGLQAKADGETPFSLPVVAAFAFVPQHDPAELKVPTLSVVARSRASDVADRSLAEDQRLLVDIGIQKKLTGAKDEVEELMALVEELGTFVRGLDVSAVIDLTWIGTSNDPIYSAEHLQKGVFTSVLTVTYRGFSAGGRRMTSFMRCQMKECFFDRPKVLAAMDAATRAVLTQFGAYVRTDARHSMPYRLKRSAPGQPPSSHKGTLRDNIFFAFDPAAHSEVIGPVRLGKGTAPGVLEHGGWAQVKSLRRHRVVGKSGEIRIGGRRSKTTRTVILPNNTRLQVTFTKLETGAQADRANLLNEQIYGPDRVRMIWVEPRPYMEPAKQKELGMLDRLWKNSLAAA